MSDHYAQRPHSHRVQAAEMRATCRCPTTAAILPVMLLSALPCIHPTGCAFQALPSAPHSLFPQETCWQPPALSGSCSGTARLSLSLRLASPAWLHSLELASAPPPSSHLLLF